METLGLSDVGNETGGVSDDSGVGVNNLGATGAFGPLTRLAGVSFVFNQEIGRWDVVAAVRTPPEETIGIIHGQPPSVSSPRYGLIDSKSLSDKR